MNMGQAMAVVGNHNEVMSALAAVGHVGHEWANPTAAHQAMLHRNALLESSDSIDLGREALSHPQVGNEQQAFASALAAVVQGRPPSPPIISL